MSLLTQMTDICIHLFYIVRERSAQSTRVEIHIPMDMLKDLKMEMGPHLIDDPQIQLPLNTVSIHNVRIVGKGGI
jgi:hypothetical protein